jgi:flagellar biogenesis protein FliO
MAKSSRILKPVVWLCASLSVLVAVPATARADEDPPTLAISRTAVEPRHALPPPAPGSERAVKAAAGSGGNWWLGAVGAVLVLALFGGASLASRRLLPRRGPAMLEVMAHACLSGKHTVYLVKAGSRVLVIGTGAQGPPALLGEWPASVQVETIAAATEALAESDADSQIGDEP